MERLTSLTQDEQALVAERAVTAAAHKANREHTGVRIYTTATEHIWAVVAGRTVKTIMTTRKGQHLNETSPCNRYAIVG